MHVTWGQFKKTAETEAMKDLYNELEQKLELQPFTRISLEGIIKIAQYSTRADPSLAGKTAEDLLKGIIEP